MIVRVHHLVMCLRTLAEQTTDAGEQAVFTATANLIERDDKLDANDAIVQFE